MDRKEIIKEYLNKIRERESITTIEKELEDLENDEIIQRYNRIKKYYEKNKYLQHKNDNELLDMELNYFRVKKYRLFF